MNHTAIACAIWTLAFMVKFGTYVGGYNMITVKSMDSDTDFKNAVIIAVQSIVTELIPLYVVLEPKFVKIFTLEYLEGKDKNDEEEIEINMTDMFAERFNIEEYKEDMIKPGADNFSPIKETSELT